MKKADTVIKNMRRKTVNQIIDLPEDHTPVFVEHIPSTFRCRQARTFVGLSIRLPLKS
jgi:hypothetical protein